MFNWRATLFAIIFDSAFKFEMGLSFLNLFSVFYLNDARRGNNHCMCPSNWVDFVTCGRIEKEVQINKKPNSATMFYVFSGGGYIKG